ncbi:superoxide dismutase [Cu-Zn]-like [Paramacrobiotus metropolitanus]|uniref:superoxide dismutase [Cu-Zn]-like n=1 Tax=Paramacrobiotus metropolitanus TaxID=2943436 RepID=UPI0024465C4C|nr:superoxide dismutase [Cu-Zn]-like [Paramacrobiotus metropolitanus]
MAELRLRQLFLGFLLFICVDCKRSATPTTTIVYSESVFVDREPGCPRSVVVTTQAVAYIISKNGTIHGSIQFDQADGKGLVSVTGAITGLQPGPHGFHIHEYGNLQDDCNAAGDHYNPDNYTHGNVYDAVRHAGDLGNIIANTDGLAEINVNTEAFTLNGDFSIIGRSVVVHADVDDLGQGKASDSKVNGHSGARLACGVIGITEEIINGVDLNTGEPDIDRYDQEHDMVVVGVSAANECRRCMGLITAFFVTISLGQFLR